MRKRFLKKFFVVVLTLCVLIPTASYNVFADTITVPNSVTNLYDNHVVTTTSTYTINGYMTYAIENNLNYSSMTIAGKTNSYTRSVAVAVTSQSGYNRTMNIVTKKTNGTQLSDFCYSGSGDAALYDANSNGKEMTHACAYYFGSVTVTAKAVSASRTYISYPSITAQV